MKTLLPYHDIMISHMITINPVLSQYLLYCPHTCFDDLILVLFCLLAYVQSIHLPLFFVFLFTDYSRPGGHVPQSTEDVQEVLWKRPASLSSKPLLIGKVGPTWPGCGRLCWSAASNQPVSYSIKAGRSLFFFLFHTDLCVRLADCK